MCNFAPDVDGFLRGNVRECLRFGGQRGRIFFLLIKWQAE